MGSQEKEEVATGAPKPRVYVHSSSNAEPSPVSGLRLGRRRSQFATEAEVFGSKKKKKGEETAKY